MFKMLPSAREHGTTAWLVRGDVKYFLLFKTNMFSSNNLCVVSWGGWLLTEGWGVCVRAFFTVRILVWFQQLMFSCRLPVGARFPLTQLFCPLLGPSKMVSGGHCCPNQQHLLSFLDQLQIGYWNGEVWDVLPVCTTASFASNFGVVYEGSLVTCDSNGWWMASLA